MCVLNFLVYVVVLFISQFKTVPYILFLTCLNDQKSVQTYVVTSSECEDLSVDCQITRVTDVLQTVQIKFLLYIVL